MQQLHYLNGFIERSRDKAEEASKHKADAEKLRSSWEEARREVAGWRTKTAEALRQVGEVEKALVKSMEENSQLLGRETAQAAQIEDLKAAQSAHEAGLKKLVASNSDQAKRIAELEREQAARAEKEKEAESVLKAREGEVEQLRAIINAPKVPGPSSEDFEVVIKDLNLALNQAKVEVEKMREDFQTQLSAASKMAVEDFKASKDFEEEKLDFSLEAYEGGSALVRQRVAVRYPALDLSFLDEAWDPTTEGVPPTGDAPL